MTIDSARRRVRVPIKEGLHMRAASILAQAARGFQSDITVTKEDRIADAKSVLDLLCLVADQDSELVIHARGPDSQQAINVLAETVLNGFRYLERSHT